MMIKKSSFRNWPLILNFDIAYLQILVLCKNKSAVRAVCAQLRNWQLGTSWPITVQDGAVTLKGSQRIADGQIFLKTLRASLFNDDHSIEPNFGRIHLAGQWL